MNHYRSILSSDKLTLDVSYSRGAVAVVRNSATTTTTTSLPSNTVIYELKARLTDSRQLITSTSSITTSVNSSATALEGSWDVSVQTQNILSMMQQQQQHSGLATRLDGNIGSGGAGLSSSSSSSSSSGATTTMMVGLTAAGLLFSTSPPTAAAMNTIDDATNMSFYFRVSALQFVSKTILSTYPVASPYTSSRYSDTLARLQAEINQFRACMNIKLKLSFPLMFKAIIDADAVNCYERIFSVIMKVS